VLLGLVAIRGADLRRAGVLALASVVVLGATGITRAAFELTGPAQLWETAYGRALLVKTGVLLGALALGRLLRHRAQYRAGVELALVAALVVAVSLLVELRPGRNVAPGVRSVVQASQPSRPPPPSARRRGRARTRGRPAGRRHRRGGAAASRRSSCRRPEAD